MSTSPSVTYRLRPVRSASAPIFPTDDQLAVIDSRERRLRVLAGPGTGKTTTLVEAVAERVANRGVLPEEVLVLTFSRRAAADLSARITRRLCLTTRAAMVRTLHSYAFGVVRSQAIRAAEPIPRLLAAGEADQMVRELLSGHVADGGRPWPDFLRGALSSPTFASELREVLLRSAGLGISPQRMIELGRRHKRPEWIASGEFAREYQQVSDLRQGVSGFGVALDQAELTAAALGALRHDELLAAEQRRVRRIFVDEYQDVDPAQAALISRLSTGADELIVFGDPDQSIYSFRGAEPSALRDVQVDRTVSLSVSRRLPATLLEATRRVASRLPGTAEHRVLTAPNPDESRDSVDIGVFPSAAREASHIADRLRRAHLLDGVPWDSMAILLRSPTVGLPALTRACGVAGVPVAIGGDSGGDVPSAEPLVAALLQLLACGVDPVALTGDTAMELLASPLGGVDALGLRRIRRALRGARPGEGSSPDLIASVLAGAPLPPTLSADLAGPLRRLRELLAIARAGASGLTAEHVLWELWQACDAERSLVAAAERGGGTGRRADRTLDAVLDVFAMAAELAQRVPLAGVAAFVAEVKGRRLPTDRGEVRPDQAVSILSAHAAKGLEWDVVAVAGVQEGTWPDLRVRGSLLAGRELLDRASGLPAVHPGAGVLAEERRLFYVACTRARKILIATGVSTQDEAPSRFLQELSGLDADLSVVPDGPPAANQRTDRRGLHLTDLLADLRRAVTDPATDRADAASAATHLARLAAAGVTGAHPDDWYGLAASSTVRSPVAPGAEIGVSPSLVESLNTCGLRAVLERRGGQTAPGQAQIEGIVVHAMANGLASGVAEPDLRAEIETFVSGQEGLPPWQLDRTRRGLLSMLSAAQAWVRDNHPPRTLIGSELGLDLPIPPAPRSGGEQHPVRLVGRVDWLSALADGSVVVTDFKTGAKVPTKAEGQNNPQLAAYQAAIALGAFTARTPELAGTPNPAGTPRVDGMADAGGPPPQPLRPGGAELVYLRSGRPKVLQQDRLTPESTAQWLGSIRDAAAHLASATAFAQENARCERCPVRTSCPLQNEGRQVTR